MKRPAPQYIRTLPVMRVPLYFISLVVFIVLVTDTLAAENVIETLLVFNSDDQTNLKNFLNSQIQSDFSLYEIGRFVRSDFLLLHARNKSYEGSKYQRDKWVERPPSEILLSVRTFETNAENVPFVSQMLYQQTFVTSGELPNTWFVKSPAAARNGEEITLVRHFDDYFSMIGFRGQSLLYWMISATLLLPDNAGIKSVLLASKMKAPPSRDIFPEDDKVPVSFLNEQLKRTQIIETFSVPGYIQVEMSGQPCIRSINASTYFPAFVQSGIRVDVYMFLSTEVPAVKWQIQLQRTSDILTGANSSSSLHFETVVCPKNITIISTAGDTELPTDAIVTFLDVEGDYNIGKFVTVEGIYAAINNEVESIPEPNVNQELNSNPTVNIPVLDFPSEFEGPLQEQTTKQPIQKQLTTFSKETSPRQTATSDQPFPSQTRSSQPPPSSGQTSSAPIITTSTSTPQRYSTREAPVTTGQTNTNSTVKCYEDLPRSWDTQINSSELQALQAEIVELKERLAVNKSALSSTIRRKNSAPDKRISSQIMGYVGGAILGLIFGGLVILDLPTIVQTLKMMKRNITGK